MCFIICIELVLYYFLLKGVCLPRRGEAEPTCICQAPVRVPNLVFMYKIFRNADNILHLNDMCVIINKIFKRGFKMAISYNKLWKLLIDKKMTKTELRIAADISTTTLAKLGKNETVSMDVMLRICKVLQCNIGDIMDATEEDE